MKPFPPSAMGGEKERIGGVKRTPNPPSIPPSISFVLSSFHPSLSLPIP